MRKPYFAWTHWSVYIEICCRAMLTSKENRRCYFVIICQLIVLKLILLVVNTNCSVCIDAIKNCGNSNQQQNEPQAVINLDEVESRVARLERRLRAMEQPIWQIRGWSNDWEVCVEGPCKCRPETKSISCWKYGLMDIPAAQLVPQDILKLDLGSNQLTSLHRDTFRNLTQLLDLDLSNNIIEHLPLNAFYYLYSVTHLRVRKNYLIDLHQNLFLKMRHLEIVDISSNKLETLPDGLFTTNIAILLLDISSNRITDLPKDIFYGLKDLEDLLLSKNRLSFLDVNTLKDLYNLKCLRLEENLLRDLPLGVFNSQINLIELNLRDNQVKTLSANLFIQLQVLTTLDLSSNMISQIHKDAFNGLVSLKELRLGKNHLKTLPKGIFLSTPVLQHLVLYANGFEKLSNGDFQGLKNLTSLFVHNNRIRYLQTGVLKDTPNLRKFQLENNQLSHIPGRFLDNVEMLQQLRLARNPWHCDCELAYLAMWLRRKYIAHANSSNTSSSNYWSSGAGAVCLGPSTFGGKSVMELTFHELCDGQWASMRGLSPRLPVDVLGSDSDK